MSTENGAAEAAVTEIIDAPAVVETTAPSAEDEARKTGWRPKEEWTGDPDNWKDAETWNDRGKITAIEKKFEDRLAKMEKVNRVTIKKLTEQHEAEKAQLLAAREAAVEAGDTKEFRRLDAKLDEHKQNAPGLNATEDGEDPKSVEAAWVKANPWYVKGSPEYDADLARYATGFSQDYLEDHPETTMAENLRQTEKALREKFPHKFKTAANGHAAVDGGGSFPGSGSNKPDPLAKLPAEARAQAKSDMKAFPKVYPTADAWIKAYQS